MMFINYYRTGLGKESPRPTPHREASSMRYYGARVSSNAARPRVAVPRAAAMVAPPSAGFLDELLKLAVPALLLAGGALVVRELSLSQRERHDREVARVARSEVGKGRFVAADLPGWPRPPTVRGHRADVYSVDRRGNELMVEVEHESTIGKSHTLKQLRAFDAWAGTTQGRRVALHITRRFGVR